MVNAVIPPDSLLLVTGVNGLVGSHAADQFLAAGYRVRGTVRDKSKDQWLTSLFASRYGPNRFELIELGDLAALGPGGVDAAALQGVAGIAHTVATADHTVAGEAEATIKSGVDSAIRFLEVAKAQESVKAFVLTSSEWALYMPPGAAGSKLTAESYNEAMVDMALNAQDLPAGFRGMVIYSAMKTRTEQACWEWVRREAPAFTFNTVLPGIVFGPSLSPKDQGLRSTANFIKQLWNGEDVDYIKQIPPQWYIDVRDNAKLHLGALILPGIDRERIFGFAGKYNWNTIMDIMRKLHPEKADFVEVGELGWDHSEVENVQRGEEILKLLGHKGWTTLEETVQANVRSFVDDVLPN